MTHNELTYAIRGAAFAIHTELGPGLLESVYEAALTYELQKLNFKVDTQVGIKMQYQGIKFDIGFRADLIIENTIILEIKSVEALTDVHHKQLLTYLKLSGLKLGLLINFNCNLLKDSIVRIANNL